MVLVPVSRDVHAPADPHPIMLHHMIKEALQRRETAGPAGDPAMQTD